MPAANLQDLTDRQAIVDLISRLGLWLDDKRFDDARSMFTEDVTIDTGGGSTRGIDGVAEQARRNARSRAWAAATPRTSCRH
jgi:hypothetical protein